MLLLQLAVEQEERLGELGRAVLERLLEQVAGAFELVATLCFEKESEYVCEVEKEWKEHT